MEALAHGEKLICVETLEKVEVTHKESAVSLKDASKCEPLEDDCSKAKSSENPEKESPNPDSSRQTNFFRSESPIPYSTKLCKGIKKKKKKKGVTCKVCCRQFRDNHNLNRHIDTKHGKTYSCSMCPAVYNTERKLQRHFKKHEAPEGTNVVKCLTCSREFRDKHNMKLHECSKSYRKSMCLYPDCGKQFYHVTKMLSHVEKEHNSKVNTVNLTFESEALFQRWKEEEELASFAYFSKRSGTVDIDFGSYRYYVCQANGENVNGPRKTNKRWKKGQVRLGKLCPSRMLVKEVNGKINVKYISLHSHDRSTNNDKLPVPKSVETYAKNLLLMGASPQQVRKNVSDGIFGMNNLIPQGGYVIRNRYFFDLKKRLEAKNGLNVDEEKDRYDPVFVYKPQGESLVVGDVELDQLPCSNDLFAIGLQTKEQCIMMKKRAHKIVCILSAETHKHLGFEILTLVVPDVFGNGYPVAHLLTSHVDEVTLRLLFVCLRKRCPSVKIKFVMTDDDVNVFNAFSSAFGNLKHLLCHWYVRSCWEDKVSKTESVKSELHSFLKAILYERSKSVFKVLCNNFVEKFSCQYPNFVKYFASNFLTRPETWAMCYRHCLKSVPNPWPYTNINMHCEYFHNKLKEFIANENESKRVADVALLLLEIQKRHSLHYKDHLSKGTRVHSAAFGKHHNGLLIKDECISYSEGLWYVKSRLNELTEYTVTKVSDYCVDKDCYEKCEENSCKDLCSHIYRCSCDDRADLCEHIHKVHSWKVQQASSFSLSPKVKRNYLEFTYSEAPEDMDDSKFNYITVVKKEKDDFSDADVDFVQIIVTEANEHTVVSQKQLPSHSERQASSQIVERKICTDEQSVMESSSAKHIQSIKYAKYAVEDNNNLHLNNANREQTESMTHSNLIKTDRFTNMQKSVIKSERIDNHDNREPIVTMKRKHYDIASREVEPQIKVWKSCTTEEDEREELMPVRSKRPRVGSVVQAAIDNKKRKLEPKSGDFEIKTEDISDTESVSDIFKVKTLKCKYCSQVFRDKYNLNRHIQNKHLQCKYCSKSFRNEYTLEKHVQLKHSVSVSYACDLCPVTLDSKSDWDKHVKKHRGSKSVQCASCLRVFRDHFNMKQHQCGKANKKSSCIYPDCEMQFYHMTQMVKHLEQDHDDKIDSDNLYFESDKMFQAWKEEEEAQSLAVFNKRNGTLGSDNVRYSYYVCQAGGHSICTTKTSRRWKNKIRTGKPCPSRMLVKEKDGKITVKYISYHSHDVQDDKRYPPLPKYVKELGKQLLLMGVSPRRVRDSIQDGVLVNNTQGTQKSFAVRNRYFYDMKKRLEKKGYIFPSEKEVSTLDQKQKEISTLDRKPKEVSALVRKSKEVSTLNRRLREISTLDRKPIEISTLDRKSKEISTLGRKTKDFIEIIENWKFNSGFNPVLVCKPQGQPVMIGETGLDSLPFSTQLFAFGMQTKEQKEIMNKGAKKVVCIRSYFDVSEDGFKLYNFVVPDKCGNGYPVAHFITNRIDEHTLSLLFTSLRKRFSKLNIPVLITDDDLDVYNAVQTVFHSDIHHFLCQGYVKTCWLQKVDQLVDNRDQKADIPFHLMNLLYEQEEMRFHSLCTSFFDKFRNSCKSFCEYFMEYFMKRPEMWALCYRQNDFGVTNSELFSHVNLHCEYLHNRLETAIMNGSFTQRIVKLTELLIRTEKEYNLLYSRNTRFSLPVNSSSGGRHCSGLLIEDKNVSKHEDTWTVISRFDRNVKYNVNVMERCCNRVSCYEKCEELFCKDLCNHLYFCSCEDRADLCEHIHKVHSLRKRLGKLTITETPGYESANNIQIIVNDSLAEEPTFEQLSVKIEPFSELDSINDTVVCHEIYELEM